MKEEKNRNTSSIAIALTCILLTMPCLNLALDLIITSKSSPTVSFLFSAMHCKLAPGWVNGSMFKSQIQTHSDVSTVLKNLPEMAMYVL